MDTGGLIQSIPFTAWQQAVFVVLFIILVGLVGYIVFKLIDKNQTFFKSEREELQAFFTAQRAQDQAEKDAMRQSVASLTTVVDRLVEVVQDMDKRLEAHDQMERGMLQTWAGAQPVRARKPRVKEAA